MLQPVTRPLIRPICQSITGALGGGFSPIGLFTASDKGYIYDNNDYVNPTTWRRNLLTYSEQFNNAVWTTSKSAGASVSANTTVAPDGTTTADTVTFAAGTDYLYQALANYPAVTGQSVAISYYSKTTLRLVILGGASPSGTDVNSFVDVGGGWYRHVIVRTFTATTSAQALQVLPSGSIVGAGSFPIWGAQLEAGSVATDYQRITDFNSDFLAAYPNTTLFVDSAGTQPATVNGLVGLQLDKSGNGLGSTEFAPTTTSVAGWTPNANCTIASVGGEIEITATAVGVCFADYTLTGTSSGKNYQLTAVCRQGQVAGSGASVALALGSVPYSVANTTTTNATVRVIKITTVGTEVLRIRFDSTVIGQKAYFSLLSVKELPGNHRYQTTTGSKPILRGTPVGSTIIANGDFATDTVWNKGSGWSIGSGVATKVAGTTNSLLQSVSVTAGKIYRFTYTVTATAGGVQPLFSGGTSAFGILRSASGTYVEYITANTGNVDAGFTVNATFAGTVDNVEIVDVSADSVTAPYGLQYDGIDDFLTTASVDFTATDKMAVVMGVRKLSDAARGMVVEFSSTSANPGTFSIEAPSSVAPTISFFNTGTLARGATVNSAPYAAPLTAVLCGIGDISADKTELRINGALVANSPGDLGTGNFGNYALYFGRRGGASLPMNGLDFGGICVGKTLTATQLASVEKWVSLRTGVTI
jgi:hypothetical protein